MKDFIIESTQQRPDLIFSAKTGEFNISGQSLPENAKTLYYPAIEWIKEYAESPASKTILSFKMKYYNTASSKMFFTMIKELNKLYISGNNVQINWCYQEDDEDMLDAGEYFRDLIDIPFEFIIYK